MDAWKCSTENSSTWFILVLTKLMDFSHSACDFLILVIIDDFKKLYPGHFEYYVRSLWDLLNILL